MQPEVRRGLVTTRWSVVLAAGARTTESDEALATLCRTYWYALYAYVRRFGYDADQAADLVQGFFLRLLDGQGLTLVRPERGRFRSFLLASLKHFMIGEHDRAHATKRGGGVPPLDLDVTVAEGRYALESRDDLDPERLYERRWALTIVQQARVRLRSACARSGKGRIYDQLQDYITGEADDVPCREAAAALGMSEGAVRVAIHRLRRKLRDLVREEIAHTVQDPAAVDEELRFLLRTLTGATASRA
jgi:RNA polymerase sigma factor (sigma-70 family)